MSGVAASSPFDFKGQPSSFAKDPRFVARGKSGKSQSQLASETNERLAQENGGLSPARVPGMTRAQRQADRVLANRWGGAYMKPGKGD